jgi:hypothetical protein
MSLTFARPASLLPPMPTSSSYTVFEDGQPIGRMYEDKQAQPELRWFTAC